MKNRSLSLALGSGGARGLAHIGVIREVEARGYRIEGIAGSSMGALIGGIYAMGKLDEYEDWVSGIGQRDILGLLDWNFSGGGIMRGNTLIRKLSELLGDREIEHLAIPFTAVAVDLDKGREVWLERGKLFDAVRASIAIPGIFTPHTFMGLELVDGGLLNPLPVAPTSRFMSDFVFAVDANAREKRVHSGTSREVPASEEAGEPESASVFNEALARLMQWTSGSEERGIGDVMLRSLDVVQASLTRHNLAFYEPDLVIGIPRNSCRIHEFHRARELITLGRQRAAKALDRFEASDA